MSVALGLLLGSAGVPTTAPCKPRYSTCTGPCRSVTRRSVVKFPKKLCSPKYEISRREDPAEVRLRLGLLRLRLEPQEVRDGDGGQDADDRDDDHQFDQGEPLLASAQLAQHACPLLSGLEIDFVDHSYRKGRAKTSVPIPEEGSLDPVLLQAGTGSTEGKYSTISRLPCDFPPFFPGRSAGGSFPGGPSRCRERSPLPGMIPDYGLPSGAS